MPRSAFTLIELLVVIAIIALVISILLPSLAAARRSGKAVVCETHLRSLGHAMQMYGDAFDGAIVRGEDQSSNRMHFAVSMLPALGWEGSFSTLGSVFQLPNSRVLKIFGEIGSYQCPEFPDERQTLDYIVNAFPLDYAGPECGQGTSASVPTPTDSTAATEIVYDNLSRLKLSSSAVIYVTEAHAKLPTDELFLRDIFKGPHLPFGTAPRVAGDKRHPVGVNALFFDGHVEQMRHTRIDAGYPKLAAERLKYFTTVDRSVADTLK